jgi:manganese efflux pump family protein
MSFYYIILIAFALAIDAFAVSMAAGSFWGKSTARQKFRLSFHFGLFQFFMPLVGWLAGNEIVGLISEYDHWLAFAVLAAVGIKMIEGGIKGSENSITKDVSRGWVLVSLAIATSIDALAVGFSIGIIGDGIFFPSLIIGIVAAAMSLVGIKSGEKLSKKFGQRVQIAGGIVLLAIGAKILIEHLSS